MNKVLASKNYILSGPHLIFLEANTLFITNRSFQFKNINRIVFTSEKLFRFGMADSPSCAFCQTEGESVEHLVLSCKVSSSFWKHVLSWLHDYNISVGRKMSFLVSSILQKIFSGLSIFCFWVSFIFTLGNARMVYLLFKVL